MHNIRIFFALLTVSFLTACGGGGGGGSDSPAVDSKTVTLTGSWNTVATNTVCTGLTASYTADFQTVNGTTISQVQRYGGGGAALIDLDTCTLISFAGDYIDLSSLALPLDVTASEFSAFAKFGTAGYYGLDPSEITVTVDVFTDDKLQYTAYGANISETLTLTR